MAPDRKLPAPINGTEQYLAALLDEIQALRAEVHALRPQPPEPPADGVIELREPASIRLKPKKD